MNLITQKIEKISYEYAKKLREQAFRNEPQITEDLQKTALKVSAEMEGLKYKLKTQKSLTEKLAANSAKNIKRLMESGFSSKDAITGVLKTTAENINDVLRYTIIFSIEDYIFGYKNFLEQLRQSNYTIPEDRIWNAWKNIGTIFDKGYRGINVTGISSQEQKFELQFHTSSGYDLKIATHSLYKESKEQTISRKRKNEIRKKLIKAAEKIEIPKGVKKL